jgi:hypothetical protein
MLDWLKAPYKNEEGEDLIVARSHIQNAMRPASPDGSSIIFTPTEKFIRTSFEALYDYLEQLENLLRLGLINFEDIETAFRYYMVRLHRPTIRHFEFLEYYDYPRAKSFLLRFDTQQGNTVPISSNPIQPET